MLYSPRKPQQNDDGKELPGRDKERLPRHPYLRGHAISQKRSRELEELKQYQWLSHVVVAAIVKRDNKYLMVREYTDDGLKINQPAGHWEHGETLIAAVCREVREEVGYQFTPTGVLGFFVYSPNPHASAQNNLTYLRIAFVGEVGDNPITQDLDPETEQVLWLTEEELRRSTQKLRSPLVLKMIDALKTKKPLPLSILQDLRAIENLAKAD